MIGIFGVKILLDKVFPNYDGGILTYEGLIKSVTAAFILVVVSYFIHNISEVFFILAMVPFSLYWIFVINEFLAIITIATSSNLRRLIIFFGFILIPTLATYINGGPTLSIRWLKLEMNAVKSYPLNETMLTTGFFTWYFLISIIIVYVTYIKCSPKYNADKKFPVYPLRVSLYLSLAAQLVAFFGYDVYLDLRAAPAFLFSVVSFNLLFFISYILSSYYFEKIEMK